MANEKVNLAEKFASFEDLWNPKVVGELNGQYVKLVKSSGEHVWHHHDDEDEMFLIVDGHMEMHLRDRVVDLFSGEFFVVPRGVEHKPVVPEGVASVVLFEPKATRSTGNVDHAYTVEPDALEKI